MLSPWLGSAHAIWSTETARVRHATRHSAAPRPHGRSRRKADHDPLRRLRSTLVTENGLGIRRADRVQRRRILFDTGNNAKIFEHNVNQLNVDLTRLDAV